MLLEVNHRKNMKILWLTWKDKKHPQAGGAEVVNEELAKRLAKAGHEIHFICGNFVGGEKYEEGDGFTVNRAGNKYTAFIFAFFTYWKKYSNWPDLVIDEINTVPYFAKFYIKQKNIIFIHQLCRQIWFYQILFPMSVIGYLLEPVYLWLLRDRKVITVSESTKNDLVKYGFKKENIEIISEGIELEPVTVLENIQKFEKPTVLSLGAIRPMKRTLEIVKAFEHLKQKNTNAELIVAGDTEGKYGKAVLEYIAKSKYSDSIIVKGRVSKQEKIELMQKSHVLAVTSIKEGWGLVVTEANSQGTPAVVYDVDGLRDSVKNNITGYVADKNTPECLSESIFKLLSEKGGYEKIRHAAWKDSKHITFEKAYVDISCILSVYIDTKRE
jgi:glycosyltransferase involved in cell wall biosynthesis